MNLYSYIKYKQTTEIFLFYTDFFSVSIRYLKISTYPCHYQIIKMEITAMRYSNYPLVLKYFLVNIPHTLLFWSNLFPTFFSSVYYDTQNNSFFYYPFHSSFSLYPLHSILIYIIITPNTAP
jgi:hypothetical protein